MDLGSGGGFPGIVLAILMREGGDGAIHLIESIGKKGVFLKMALAETGGAGQVHIIRIEDAPRLVSPANVITARALAPLTDLLALAFPWMSSGAIGLFHKGREFRKEIELARDQWAFNLVEHQSKVDVQSVILEISNVSQRL